MCVCHAVAQYSLVLLGNASSLCLACFVTAVLMWHDRAYVCKVCEVACLWSDIWHVHMWRGITIMSIEWHVNVEHRVLCLENQHSWDRRCIYYSVYWVSVVTQKQHRWIGPLEHGIAMLSDRTISYTWLATAIRSIYTSTIHSYPGLSFVVFWVSQGGSYHLQQVPSPKNSDMTVKSIYQRVCQPVSPSSCQSFSEDIC